MASLMIPSLGPHAIFIVAAYAAALLVVLGLALWVIADYLTQRGILDELDRQGVTRRSAREPGERP